MKKKNGLCLGLALLVLLQCLSAGAAASEVPVIGTPSVQPTEPPLDEPAQPQIDISNIPFGTAGVAYGCKTLDAKTALGGGEKLLSTARGVFVYETRSDTVLYNYNPDERLAPGGLVQIVNAMLVLENCDLDQTVTVSTYYINQLPPGIRHQSLRNGEEISVRDLLYCMLVTAANDAAMVLAQVVGGTPDQFIRMMNQRVQDLGCANTNITTVSGLDEDGQYSTARDMAKILDAAMENETFREIAGTGRYTVPATNKSEPRELKSTNYMLKDAAISRFYDERVTACKASYTSSAAGATVAFAAESEELSLICVIIGSTRRYGADSASPTRYGNFEEAEQLMKHCFDGFHVCRLLYQGQTMTQLQVAGGANDVTAVNRSNIDIVLPKGVGLQDLTMEYDTVGGTLRAPVQDGQEVATLQLWHGTCCVGETTLYAMTGVATAEEPGYTIQSGATRSDSDMTQLLIFLGIALAVILVPIGIWAAFVSIRRNIAMRRARKLRRQRRDERMRSRRNRR